MTEVIDHYALLGLRPDASYEAVRRATDQLARQADLLAYTAPQRSREMWGRVRQIRHDLLESPDRRIAYDRARAAEFAPKPPVLLRARTAPASRRSPALLLPAALAALAGAGLVAALVTTSNDNRHSAQTPLAFAPAGQHSGSQFMSNNPVTLAWSPVQDAQSYQVRFFAQHGDGTWKYLRDDIVTAAFDTVRLPGERRYRWEVRSLIGGKWGPFSSLQDLMVARPTIAAPMTLQPENNTAILGTRVKLCWLPVEGAAGYHLRVRGVGVRGLHGTCQTFSVRPGRYRWTVAALVRGVRTYIGTYSAAQYFTVRQEVAAREKRTSRKSSGSRTTGRRVARAAPAALVASRTGRRLPSAAPPATGPTAVSVNRGAPARQSTPARTSPASSTVPGASNVSGPSSGAVAVASGPPTRTGAAHPYGGRVVRPQQSAPTSQPPSRTQSVRQSYIGPATSGSPRSSKVVVRPTAVPVHHVVVPAPVPVAQPRTPVGGSSAVGQGAVAVGSGAAAPGLTVRQGPAPSVAAAPQPQIAVQSPSSQPATAATPVPVLLFTYRGKHHRGRH